MLGRMASSVLLDFSFFFFFTILSDIIETTAHLLSTSAPLIFFFCQRSLCAPLKYDTYFSEPESNYECF